MEEEKKHIDELIATYLTEGLDKNALAELKAWIAALTGRNCYIQSFNWAAALHKCNCNLHFLLGSRRQAHGSVYTECIFRTAVRLNCKRNNFFRAILRSVFAYIYRNIGFYRLVSI